MIAARHTNMIRKATLYANASDRILLKPYVVVPTHRKIAMHSPMNKAMTSAMIPRALPLDGPSGVRGGVGVANTFVGDTRAAVLGVIGSRAAGG